MHRALTVLIFGLALTNCSKYNAPPEPSLELPDSGIYEVGQSLTIRFTEAVDPSSVAIRVWPSAPEDLTLENEFADGVTPQIETCQGRAHDSTDTDCKGADLVVDEDGWSAVLTLTDDAFSQAKVPWKLEVVSGLADKYGNKTGVPYLFDFQFEPAQGQTIGDVEFENGAYHMLATINDPLPVVLTLFVDIVVAPDGTTRVAGGKVAPIGKAAKNTTDTSELAFAVDENSFGMFMKAMVTDDGTERFMKSEPITMPLKFGEITVMLNDLRITATVVNDPETNKDRLEGTVFVSTIQLDVGTGDKVTYESINAAFFAQQIPEENIPDGRPLVCGDHCGVIPVQCDPPKDFVPDGFCDN